MSRFLRQPLDATIAAMEPIVAGPRPLASFALVLLSMVACWYVYVPIHELLHALGCAATGGTVTTLEIQVQYGGSLLAKVFPFVSPGGEYAGRLSDFDTHGRDLTYLATDALPFALSVLLGVPALRACAHNRRPLLLGAASVLGLAPFYNLPGDYYEMGSILTTALASPFVGDFTALRADDLPRLIVELVSTPEALGTTSTGAAAFAIVGVSTAVAVALAYATFFLGDALAKRWVGFEAPPAERA